MSRHKGRSWFQWAVAALREFAGLAPSASESTFTYSAFANAANGSTETTLTFTAKDAAGNVMPNLPLTWTQERITLVAGDGTVTASPATIQNDGVARSYVRVTMLDPDGNPVRGLAAASCVLAVSGTGNTLTQPTLATDRNGQTTGSFVSTGAAAKTASFTVAGLAITDTAAVTVSATTLFSHSFADGTFGGLDTYQILPGIVTDATALSGKSVQVDWTTGAEVSRSIAYEPIAQYNKLYMRIHYKQDATADNTGIKKTVRFRANVNGVADTPVGTFNIQGSRFLFFGDNYGDGTNENQTGYPGSDPIYVDNQPNTFRSTWRYIEVMVDYADPARQKASMWIDGVLVIDRDDALSPSIHSSVYFDALWVFSTFNDPKDNRSEWLGEVVVSTALIGMP